MFEHIREDDDKNLVEKGFTLVELLIVVVILGILAGIVVFAVGNLTDDAAKNACSTEASTVETAIEAYKAKNNGTEPTNMASLTSGGDYLRDTPKNYDTAATPAADKFSVDFASGDVTRGAECVAS